MEVAEFVEQSVAEGEVVFLLGMVQRVEQALGQVFKNGGVSGIGLVEVAEFVEQSVAEGDVVLLLGIVHRVEQAHSQQREWSGFRISTSKFCCAYQ